MRGGGGTKLVIAVCCKVCILKHHYTFIDAGTAHLISKGRFVPSALLVSVSCWHQVSP